MFALVYTGSDKEVITMYDRILVPLDGSRFSTRALKYAADLAPRYCAALVLVSVVEPERVIPSVADPTGMASPVVANAAVEQARYLEERNRTRARRYLAGKVRALKAEGIAAEYVLEYGHPAEAIMKTAKKKKADLIVMATHGRGGLKRAFMGSVADKVIRESREPVLVIRARATKK